jgi:3-hydroxyisobutyrate dehydrogenase-like beta-hydroxyacid dehydrogenase
MDIGFIGLGNMGFPMARATKGSANQRPAQDTTRNSPTTVKNRARWGQARSQAIAYVARLRACVSFSRDSASLLRMGSDGSGVTPLNQLSRLPGRTT